MPEDGAASEFPVASYVLIPSLLTYVIGPYAYVLDVPRLLYVICHVSNLVLMLISIKLKGNLPI